MPSIGDEVYRLGLDLSNEVCGRNRIPWTKIPERRCSCWSFVMSTLVFMLVLLDIYIIIEVVLLLHL